jgi:hypothetical protein
MPSAGRRDAALARLRRVRWIVATGAVGLAAGFSVLAHAATPGYQKRRHAIVTAASGTPVGHSTVSHHRRRHHRRRHAVATGAPSGPRASAAPQTSPAASAPAPAPSAPAPVQPAPAPAPAPPAASQQAPATVSGGS